MHNYRHRLLGLHLTAMLAIAVTACLFVASAPAQEPQSHDGEAAHTHAEGDESHHADTGHDAAADHEAGDGGEHGYSGLASDLPFWGIVAFIGFIFAIKKLGWGSFTAGMASREEEEQRLISEAEELRRQASEQLTTQRGQMEAVDEHVRSALAEADRDAEHTRQDIRAATDREVDNVRARVDLEINRVKDQTLNDVFENFTQRVIDATQDRLQGQLDSAGQDRLINAALDEFPAGKT